MLGSPARLASFKQSAADALNSAERSPDIGFTADLCTWTYA